MKHTIVVEKYSIVENIFAKINLILCTVYGWMDEWNRLCALK